MAAPRPTLGHYQGGSLTHPMFITCILHIPPKGHQESHNKVGSLPLAECLVGFELETLGFWSQHLNPLGHSPKIWWIYTCGALGPWCMFYATRHQVSLRYQPPPLQKHHPLFFVKLYLNSILVFHEPFPKNWIFQCFSIIFHP